MAKILHPNFTELHDTSREEKYIAAFEIMMSKPYNETRVRTFLLEYDDLIFGRKIDKNPLEYTGEELELQYKFWKSNWP